MDKEEIEAQKKEILAEIKKLQEAAAEKPKVKSQGTNWTEKQAKYETWAIQKNRLLWLLKWGIIILAIVFVIFYVAPKLFGSVEMPGVVKSVATKLGISAGETEAGQRAGGVWGKIVDFFKKPEEYMTAIGDWKSPMKQEVSEELKVGAEIKEVYPKRSAYKFGEKIGVAGDVVLYGLPDKNTKAKFQCRIGNEVVDAEPKERVIYQGQQDIVHVNCEFEPRYSEGKKVKTETAVLEVVYEDYVINGQLGLYVIDKDELDEIRRAGKDPFEGIKSKILTSDRRTRAVVDDGPIVLSLGVRDTQPLVNDRVYEVGVGLDENSAWEGKTAKIKDLGLIFPSDFFEVQKGMCEYAFKDIDKQTKRFKFDYKEYGFYGEQKEELNTLLRTKDKSLSDANDYWCAFNINSKDISLSLTHIYGYVVFDYIYSKKTTIDIGEGGINPATLS